MPIPPLILHRFIPQEVQKAKHGEITVEKPLDEGFARQKNNRKDIQIPSKHE